MKSNALTQLIRETPIVVTGCGAVSAAGTFVSDLWQRAVRGEPAAEEREFLIGGEHRSVAVCPAPPIDPALPENRPVRRMDRSAQLGWVAANQALHAAGLAETREGLTIGAMVGTSRGPVGKLAEGFARTGDGHYPPSLSADCTFASFSGVLGQALQLSGPNATISATCASGAFAIGLAAEQLLLGKADVMLVGAAEAPLVPAVIAQLRAAGVLGSHPVAARTCRPFDVTRNGLCLGEGSAFLVLESAASAARRGRRPVAQLAGWGMAVDDSGRVGINESGNGLIVAATRALAAAGLEREAIDYVNAHGTGTKLNDSAEANALRRLLGPRITSLPCTSTKPVTGHCLGATPVLEAVIAIESLRHQTVPPTANCHQQDPACALNILPKGAESRRIAHVMSNSLGFWGYHASLIFSRADPGNGPKPGPGT